MAEVDATTYDLGVPTPLTTAILHLLSSVSAFHYSLSILLLVALFLYTFLEFHLVRDLLRGCRGDPVRLTFHPSSHVYRGVASRCKTLHGRYLPTPWLSSPHLQTACLGFFANIPALRYTREVFRVADGGSIALDWLLACDVIGSLSSPSKCTSRDTTPIVVVVPGLTSDSSSSYVKQLTYRIAKRGWNTVVVNHRGLGGISLTSDCFYNAGWTEDIRFVIDHLHLTYPVAPLFLVGTSIGANIVVKYLGEDGENTPIAGAASICSPWDLLIGDRFINRKLVQKFYNRVLAVGLKGYAQMHQPVLSRMANWEGIKKSRSVRDFDDHATRIAANYETVDTYYRQCSSVRFIGNVSVPLLCISALDDPVCSKEAIPWDECRANKNIVLATTKHGGHLAFFQGMNASNLWWVGAVDEFLGVLHFSPYMHRLRKPQIPATGVHSSLESSIDKAPYINVMEDGMLTAVGNKADNLGIQESSPSREADEEQTVEDLTCRILPQEERNEEILNEPVGSSVQEMHGDRSVANMTELLAPVKRTLAKLSRRSSMSLWLLAYVAIVTTWPLIGSTAFLAFKRRLKNRLPKLQQRK